MREISGKPPDQPHGPDRHPEEDQDQSQAAKNIAKVSAITPARPKGADRFGMGPARKAAGFEEGKTDQAGEPVETDEAGETDETDRPEGWSETKWELVDRERDQLERRIDKALEAADHLPDLGDLPPATIMEVENLAQDIRLAGAYLKEQIQHLQREPDEQQRLSSTVSMDAALNARLADVKDLEEHVRHLPEEVAGGVTAAPPRPANKRAYQRVLSWLDYVKHELMKVLDKIWPVVVHLLTLKEWTVGGELSTGPFGLAKASVSLKFGK